MEKTNTLIYFAIKGDFNPDDITQIILINPSKQWRAGDKRQYATGQYQFSMWQYDLYNGEELQLPDWSILLEPLINKISILKNIKLSLDVYFMIALVPTIYDDYTPGLFFDRDIIRFCYETDTEIDIDIYTYSQK